VRRAEHGGIISRVVALLFLVGVLACLYLARHPLMRFAAWYWEVNEPPDHADAIVVLGDDNFSGQRAARAAEIYKAGWAPQVVASGRMLRPYAGVSELIAHDLQADGVPAYAVVRFPHNGTNTTAEAEALLGLAATRHWKRLLIVTSNYHTRRARLIFGRVFPHDGTLRFIAAPDADFDPAHWWESRAGRKIFFLEILGDLEAHWELPRS